MSEDVSFDLTSGSSIVELEVSSRCDRFAVIREKFDGAKWSAIACSSVEVEKQMVRMYLVNILQVSLTCSPSCIMSPCMLIWKAEDSLNAPYVFEMRLRIGHAIHQSYGRLELVNINEKIFGRVNLGLLTFDKTMYLLPIKPSFKIMPSFYMRLIVRLICLYLPGTHQWKNLIFCNSAGVSGAEIIEKLLAHPNPHACNTCLDTSSIVRLL